MQSPSSPQPVCAACTIISPNYLAYARTLAASYLAHHPGHRFFVLVVASLTGPAPFAAEPFETVLLSALDIPNLRGIAMKYDILELNTNVKPSFMRHLIRRHRLDRLVYLDPDICVYAPLTPVFAALDSSDAVLTPHITAPIDDDKLPGEQTMLYNGTYNLGFIAVRNTPESDALLAWWERRCLTLGFSEGRTGLFVDQKWMNLAPGLFDRIAILRHPGCNMAYWNLHERTLTSDGHVAYTLNPTPYTLHFFHFSGVVIGDPEMLSKNTDRFTLADRPDLRKAFDAYKSTVLANKKPNVESLNYGYGAFSDGTTVTRLARRIYAKHASRWAGQDPFDSNGAFARFAVDLKLVQGTVAPKKETWGDFKATDRRVEAVHFLLKLALRFLGPHRYELLMRYLAHIAVLRNQSVFLDNKSEDPR